MRWTITTGRHEDDAQKAVLPALIYTKDEVFGGYSLSLGWWDWSINLIWYGTTGNTGHSDGN